MKILIISASPRKGGSSDVLCGQFAKARRRCGMNKPIHSIIRFANCWRM